MTNAISGLRLPSQPQRSPPSGRYRIILLGNGGTRVWTTCPRVSTQPRHDRQLNPRPPDRKTDTRPIAAYRILALPMIKQRPACYPPFRTLRRNATALKSTEFHQQSASQAVRRVVYGTRQVRKVASWCGTYSRSLEWEDMAQSECCMLGEMFVILAALS